MSCRIVGMTFVIKILKSVKNLVMRIKGGQNT